ncbi:nuclear transport factor 2 family protein [Longimicrobium sp.]|jgi:ketosteroid isomerase-like protein|uniref:nuclear transport factor 2 family protein n=1 Tax=Longimicrobium sp. TaxID=2029185 RepID=UPI002ED8A509
MRRPALLLGLALVLGTLAACSAGPAPRTTLAAAPDSAGAAAAARGFLAAFDSLNWEPFRAYLADDITMFFPFPDAPARHDGRDAVEARFRPFFEQGRVRLRESGRTRQGLAPRDMHVQMLGADAAAVSFHLGGERPARRSLVFRRTADGAWKLAHWHASPPPAQPAPAPAPSGASPSP